MHLTKVVLDLLRILYRWKMSAYLKSVQKKRKNAICMKNLLEKMCYKVNVFLFDQKIVYDENINLN